MQVFLNWEAQKLGAIYIADNNKKKMRKFILLCVKVRDLIVFRESAAFVVLCSSSVRVSSLRLSFRHSSFEWIERERWKQ